ncbi:MAG: hypothetical protein IPF72_06025 [Chitinophagaceae bacterium]|nr:hypothetical protein [Chitinophagaceae bacterium]
MSLTRLFITTLIIFSSHFCVAQTDSIFQALENLQKVPVKYLNKVENKIDKYSNRITGKTEKTLAKLSKWENKIKNILDQVSPETSAKLFGSNATTFGSLLKKLQEGKTIAEGYKTKYNEYRDKLTTSIKYLEDQKDKLDKKLIQPINTTKKKLNELEEDVSNTEAVEAFIKERKQQLINEAFKYIGKSKYLTKIDKESYYYIETLRNYKELFTDKKKAEELALKLLNKIPAFTRFMQDNSMLASLFGSPNTPASMASLQGLQTRASVNALIQNQIASGGPNALEIMKQNFQEAQAQVSQLKDKVMQRGGSSSDANIPNFKPNNQKSKTFLQRLEFGSNFQFAKNNSLVPTTADIALSVGYKLNDKSVVGIGASYKMGLGSIQRISISHQGIGIRSFIDWKLKWQIFVTGGYELNYNAQFKNLTALKQYNDWQQVGLVGLTKKINVKTKFFNGTSVQLLYDMLYRQHNPVSQPILFRMGYKF